MIRLTEKKKKENRVDRLLGIITTPGWRLYAKSLPLHYNAGHCFATDGLCNARFNGL